jgi:predicted PolB exonuclease-like 3'-5' exonuclease|nr:MAG TPA: hypothetical protein [Caudoviricetes sp.]
MSEAINLTNVLTVDRAVFLNSFQEESTKLLENLLTNLKNEQDRATVQEVAMKMIALYQKMYTSDEEEVKAIQRSLNNYKSAVAAISARYKLDVANTIIAICKKASVLALSAAVNFVVL